ncbi:MAG: DUF1175 family protein [Pyrinomonadaceae bacterium]
MRIERIKKLLSPLRSWKIVCCSLIILSALLVWRLYSQTTSASAAQKSLSTSRINSTANGEHSQPSTTNAGTEALANRKEPRAEYWSDDDRDGIPDRAELRTFSDRENFRRWFAAIAETQFYQLSDEWNPQQRDCAGLVRFAWREALRSHDRAWFQRMGADYTVVAPDVDAYKLQRSALGEKLFRTDFGTFKAQDLTDGKFSEFADARTLKNFNSTFISRDRKQARAGDLIFFYQPYAQKLPYHVMVFLGEAQQNSDGASDWVVYHTGASVTDQGTVKKVRLSVLDHHPDRRWRPVEDNRNFLGFYRLKILE